MAGDTKTSTKKTTPTTAPASNDLQNIMNSLGITQDQLSAMSGTYASNDPAVYIGTTDSKGKKRRDNPVVKTSYAYQAPYRWKPDDLTAFQRRMFAAGLYGDQKITDIRWGIVDPYTQRAWQQLVDTSAAYYAAGKKITPQEVLDKMGIDSTVGGASQQVGKPTNTLDVNALARQTSTDVLGRGLTPEEQTQFTNEFRGMEAPYLTGDAEQQAPDSQEWARQRVRAIDPIRADSRSTVKVASVLEQMLAGKMPSQSQRLPGGTL